MRRHHILIPIAALIATLPIFIHGCSCGHDFDFHMLSWLEAANQFRHGTLNPHWAFSPAFNAGEPRFVFYPPLSWTLGALLTMLFPIAVVPAIYTWIVLTAAGFTMHRLAQQFTSPNAAILASAFYIANPYMLFNAFERTAYAELLAAAWLPLLFLAALRKRPTIRGLASPVALLWLTNAPAAVMGCYTLAVVITMRVGLGLIERLPLRKETSDDLPWSGPLREATPLPTLQAWFPHHDRFIVPWYSKITRDDGTFLSQDDPLIVIITSVLGTTLGLALAAFYLLPAAYERRFVQIAMAVIPNMRFQDNFLFGHTGDAPHDAVLHTASLLAVTLFSATVVSLIASFNLSRTHNNPVILSGARSAKPKDLHESWLTAHAQSHFSRELLLTLTTLTLLIAFLLTPLSTELWSHLPEIGFLQFPWRLLSILAVVLTLSIATALRFVPMRAAITAPLALVLTAALTLPSIHTFRQGCERQDLPANQAQTFSQHRGVEATDEYTPTDADNDVLRADDPPFWLADSPAAFAPNTTPNPAAADPSYSGPPPSPTHPGQPAPLHAIIHATSAGFLILNLRDFPAWDITLADPNSRSILHPAHIPRDDGLITLPLLHGGDYTLDITWHRPFDQNLGLLTSVLACIVFAVLTFRAAEPQPLTASPTDRATNPPHHQPTALSPPTPLA